MSSENPLFLIGGAADTVIADFVRLAGGTDAHIVIVTHAAAARTKCSKNCVEHHRTPRMLGTTLEEDFRELGVKYVKVITPQMKDQTIPPDTTAIYLGGGDQSRLVSLTEPTGLAEQIRDCHRRGVLVGGSSAGAAGQSHVMIADGMQDGVLVRNSLIMGKGLCLIPGVVMDTHFNERGRQNRLRAALATVEGVSGIGLDEDTAIHVQGQTARVFGAGKAWVYWRGIRWADTWEELANGVNFRTYSAGDVFHI